MDKTYNHKEKENEIYEIWDKSGVFSPEGAAKKRLPTNPPYTVLMPPPNANAALHCGHATYAIQDVMTRFKRMQGFNALYLPGTDHAGFETQVVYERKLKESGKSRFDFDRETFYNEVLNFVKENSDVAISQLKKVGISADWDRNTFMLEEKVLKTVHETFIKMFKDGMVYRDGYMVNYSTFHGTTFSDLETEYKDSISPLYYIRYRLKSDSSKYIVVATVRPETVYADVAIAVNPKDKRYKDFVNELVINPLNNREIPVIKDDYVDMEFGTGALKITPGHDFNDYQIGKKHNNLEIISLINLDGTMNEHAIHVVGMYPKPARKKVSEVLTGLDALEKVDENYANRVLVDYKDGQPIEPMVLPNWFIDIDRLVDMTVEAIESDRVKFNLSMWKRDILRWIKEKKPWPISRQTVFGVSIPVWYGIEENPSMQVTFLNSSKEYTTGVISELLKEYELKEIKEGLQKVILPVDAKFEVSVESPGENYLPETDTFDTWFSSGQWPLTTTGYPDGEDFKKHFPTDFLDSGYDIMFFWIARMIMFSLYLTGEVPFKNVYFHGMITDKSGKKMSKSRGNVINPMEFIEKYGADALRMGILVGGNTEAKLSPLDEDKVRGYRNFANKIWNIARFINMKVDSLSDKEKSELEKIDVMNLSSKVQVEDKEILLKLNELVKDTTKNLNNYKFKPAGEDLYHFIWEDLANTYLEQIKDRKDIESIAVLRQVFLASLKLLHPFMPFITEAVWQEISKPKSEADIIIITAWPEFNPKSD